MDQKVIIIGILILVVLLLTKSTWLLKRLIVGVGLLFLINLIGNKYGFTIAINEYTSAVVCVLGVPGVGALLIIQHFIL